MTFIKTLKGNTLFPQFDKIISYLKNNSINTKKLEKKYGSLIYPMIFSSYKKHEAKMKLIVKLLLKHGANIKLNSVNGYTILGKACSCGYFNIAKMLIKKGAEYSTDALQDILYKFYINYKRSECIELFNIIIKKIKNVDKKDRYGYTPLFTASKYSYSHRGSTELIKSLLDHGADGNIVCENGETPFFNLCKNGNSDVVKIMIETNRVDKNSFNIRTDYDRTALHWAACGGYHKIVKLLLDNGANINEKYIYDNHVIYNACYFHSPKTVKILIEYGANINLIFNRNIYSNGNRGDTLLHLVSKTPSTTKINDVHYQYLEQKERIKNLKILKKYGDVAKLLLYHGININVKNSQNKTAIFYACKYEHGDIAKLLAEYGANISDLSKEYKNKKYIKEGIRKRKLKLMRECIYRINTFDKKFIKRAKKKLPRDIRKYIHSAKN